MMKQRIFFVAAFAISFLIGISFSTPDTSNVYGMGRSETVIGEWLKTRKENGQTFSQYRKSKPNVLAGRRRKLYVQPIGEFTKTDDELIAASAEFLSIYFNCEVVTNETLPETVIPDSAQRTHPRATYWMKFWRRNFPRMRLHRSRLRNQICGLVKAGISYLVTPHFVIESAFGRWPELAIRKKVRPRKRNACYVRSK